MGSKLPEKNIFHLLGLGEKSEGKNVGILWNLSVLCMALITGK